MTHEDGEAGILSFAALRVTRRRETEASFHLVHRAYRGEEQALRAYAEMGALLSRGCLVIGEAAPRDGPIPDDDAVHRSCLDGMAQGLPMLGAEEPPHVSAMVMRDVDSLLEALAENYSIPFTPGDASLEQQARGLADRVQTLWLTWLCTCCPAEESRHLGAALDAWRQIEAARSPAF